MNRPTDIDYADYAREHEPELLQAAVDAISPDIMGMDRNQALTLAGAMKNCGFSSADFAAVMARSSADKGTFAKQWDKFRGSGSHGTAGAGTIFDYALKSGWKWPAPDRTAAKSKETGQKLAEDLPALLAKWHDDFKISCIMDSVGYASKPAQKEAQAIRKREQTPTPMPEPMSLQDFAAAVTSGHTFSPTVYNKVQAGTNETGQPVYTYTPMCQQIFVADIDNEEPALDDAGKPIKGQKKRIENPLTIDSAIEICKKQGIMPFFVYETFSSKEHREDPALPYQKFRLCFALDKPMQVQEWGTNGIGKAISYFIGLFGKAADSKTTDPARLIYGTDEKDRATLYTSIIDSKKFLKKINPAPDPAEPSAEDPKQETIPGGMKMQTASEYLINGKFEEDIAYFKQFKDRKTGFMGIDEHLTLYPGLAVLGGASSLGKTTFAVNLADNLIDRGESVLFFSLEQLPIEIVTKSLSRALYQRTPERILTNIDIKNGATNNTLESIKRDYAKRAGSLYLIEGDFTTTATKIINTVEQWIEKTGKKPIVIIDYLQLIAPPEGRFTEQIRLSIDENLKALKNMQKRNKLFVLVISSFNRSESLEPVSYEAFKESGMIEFTCDYVWGLQYYIQRADNDSFYITDGASKGKRQTTKQERRKMLEPEQRNTPRHIQFVSLKSRNGKQRYTTEFFYYPQFDVYEEENPFKSEKDIFEGLRGKVK